MGQITLTDEQNAAVKMVQDNQLSVLTGAAGTGKTTVIKAVLDWAASKEMVIACAAPSGKAAKRMTEATGYHASTIHSLLGAMVDDYGRFVFSCNVDNQLEVDLIVLDEVSMVSNHLMARFLEAVTLDTIVLLVGDPNQLPSIGAGAVLRDLLVSEIVPHTRLTEIHRAGDQIVVACNKVKDGEFYDRPDILDPDGGQNIRHIEASSHEQIQSIIAQIVCDRMPERGFDPVWDVQVLSPTNKKTLLSCESLNAVLQNRLNPVQPEKLTKGCIFRKGDKVINTKNKSIDEDYVVNGALGEIIRVSKERKELSVRFNDPTVDVVLPFTHNDLLLAYCITCHRYQGSEAPVIIVPVHSSFNFFVNRAWLYTALSRGQQIVITVGEFSAIQNAIRTRAIFERKTMLCEKLHDAFVGDI